MRVLWAVVMVLGCAPEQEGSTAGDGGATDASTGAATTTGATASEGSLSMTGASASQTSVATAADDTSSGGATSGSTGASSDGADVTTAAGDPCAGLSQDECMADRACTAITCQPYVVEPSSGAYCIGMREYIGCRTADLGCDDARMHTCEGIDAQVYVCGDTCIPEGWEECAPPAMGVEVCG